MHSGRQPRASAARPGVPTAIGMQNHTSRKRKYAGRFAPFLRQGKQDDGARLHEASGGQVAKHVRRAQHATTPARKSGALGAPVLCPYKCKGVEPSPP